MFKSFKSVLMLLTVVPLVPCNSYNSYRRRRSPSYCASCGGMPCYAVVSILCLLQGKGIESQSVTCQAEAQKTRSPLNLESRKTFTSHEKSLPSYFQKLGERLHFRFWRLQNKIQNDPKRWYTMRIPIRVELPAVSKEHKRSSHE